MNKPAKYKPLKKTKIDFAESKLSKDPLALKEQIKKLKKENKKLNTVKQTVNESESKYRSLFEMSDDAILVIENEKFVDCNRAVVKMLGYKNKAEVLNTHPSELSPLKQPDGRLSYEKAEEMMGLALKNGSHHFEWIHTKANGENFPVEVWLCSMQHNKKTLINTIWRDLTEKKKAENLILKNIAEKEILLKEIHHRVKNNLQIISSLLSLQAANINEDRLKQILEQSKYRIESMAKIHEMLYNTQDMSEINFADYVLELVHRLIYSTKETHQNIKLKVDIKSIYFTINTAIPLGLLINEIITNSLKHGITENSKGEISVSITEKNDQKLEMRISDNGIGYASSFDAKNFNS
ncbi:MAG: PAS domain S-box protein, partial [Bacteroidetes bacterium]|nr:PAS domain S-box protein [Bacteroidota bacterium]